MKKGKSDGGMANALKKKTFRLNKSPSLFSKKNLFFLFILILVGGIFAQQTGIIDNPLKILFPKAIQNNIHSKITTIEKLVLVKDDPKVKSYKSGNKICTREPISFENLKTKEKKTIKQKTSKEVCFDISNYKDKLKGAKEKIHIGSTSDIYQLVDIVVYEGNDWNITASLKLPDGSYEEGTAWVIPDSLKFGYNLTDNSWKRRRYEIHSKLPIKRKGDEFFFVDGSTAYKIDTSDICNQYNQELEQYSECYFSTWKDNNYYYLAVDFYGNDTDPQIVIEQLNDLFYLNQTRWEDNYQTHLAINNSNVVAYYPFDKNYKYTDGQIGDAVIFSGAGANTLAYNSSASLSYDFSNDYSICYWINREGDNFPSSNYEYAFMEFNETGSKKIEMRVSSGYLQVYAYDSLGASTSLSLASKFSDNTKHHICLNYNATATNLSVWYDNQNLVNISVAAGMPAGKNYFQVGASEAADSSGYYGIMDEFKIFNKSLTPSEISTIYTNESNGNRVSLGQIAELRFEFNDSDLYGNYVKYYENFFGPRIIRDYSGNDNDLTGTYSYSHPNQTEGVIGKAIQSGYYSTYDYGGTTYYTSSMQEFNQDTDFTFSFWANTSKPFHLNFFDSASNYYPFGVGFDGIEVQPNVFVQNTTRYGYYYFGNIINGWDNINDTLFISGVTYFIRVVDFDPTTHTMTLRYIQDDGDAAYYPGVINETKLVVYTPDGADSLLVYDWNGTNLTLVDNVTDNIVNVRKAASLGNYYFEVEYYDGLHVWKWNGTNLVNVSSYLSGSIDSSDLKIYPKNDTYYWVFSAQSSKVAVYGFDLNTETLNLITSYTGTYIKGVDYDPVRDLVFTNQNGDLYIYDFNGTALTLRVSYNSGQINGRDRYGMLHYDNETGSIIMSRYYLPNQIYKFNETDNSLKYIGRLGPKSSSFGYFRNYKNTWLFVVYKYLYSYAPLQSEAIQDFGNSKANVLIHLLVTYNSSSRQLTLYENGTKIGSTTINFNFSTVGSTFYIAGDTYLVLNGIIDDVLLLNKTITDVEAQEIYNEQYPKFYNEGTSKPLIWKKITTDINRVNLTLNTEQYNGTSVQARIHYASDYNNTDPNLKLYFHFDNDSTYGENDTHTYDFSGNGNNGTIYGGASYTNGFYDKALNFDGTDDYVNAGNDSSLDITSAITISAWIYPSTPSVNADIVGKRTATGDGGFAFVYETTNDVAFWIMDGGVWRGPATSSTLTTETWHHVVATYDGAQIKVYVDGKLDGSVSYTGDIDSNTADVLIGLNIYKSGYFKGKIDDVMIWNRSLSVEEIEDLYINGRFINGTTTAYQTFSAGKDTKVFNITNGSRFIRPEIKLISNSFGSYTPLVENSITLDTWTEEVTPPTPTPDTTPPIVTLVSPANATSAFSPISFTANFTDNVQLANATLYAWDSVGTQYTNSTTITGTSNETTLILDLIPDTYTWNYYACDNSSNCAWASDNYTLTVVFGDDTPPQYSNIIETPTDPSTYSAGATYEFNITWIDNFEVDTVIFTWEGVNYTITSSTENYSKTFTDLPAGTYTYSWWANDTSGNTNSTGNLTYTINKATSTCSILGDNVTYPNTLLVNGSCTNPEATATLYKNDTAVSNPYTEVTAAGVYLFKINVSETQNYTSAEASIYVEVYKGTPTLTISGTTPITYGTVGDVTGTGCPSQLTCNLYRNNTLVSNPDATILGAGSYLYVYNTTGNENYTSASDNFTLIVNKATGVVYTYLNNTRANITIENGTSIWLNGTLEVGTGTIKLYNNGTLINQGLSPLSNYTLFDTEGLYNITTIYDGNENYTSAYETWWVNVTYTPPTPDTTPPTWVSLTNKTCYVNQSCSHSVEASDASGIDTYWLNDTSVFTINSSGNIWNITNLVNVTTYWLNISVNDTAGNINWGVIYINVTALPASQCNGNYTTLKSIKSTRPYGRLCYWLEF